MTSRFAAALGCTLFWVTPLSALADNRHPLDPLSWQEQWAALEVLLDAGMIDEDTTFNRIALKPPAKDAV